MKFLKGVQFLFGMTFGSTLTFFLDGRRGKARRTMIQDKVKHYVLRAQTLIYRRQRGAFYKTMGMFAELRGRLKSEPHVLDEVLVARIRSRIGRNTSYPHAIEVLAHDGQVTLKGRALPYEIPDILDSVKSTRGVRSMDNQIQAPAGRTDKTDLAA
jgi:hypothetical protein